MIYLLLLSSSCAVAPTAVVVEGHSCTIREEPALVHDGDIELGVIQVGRDSERLDGRARAALTNVASQLREQPEARVRIEGDLRPARAAKRFLVASGVTHCRFEVGFDAERARERRVDIMVIRH